MLTSSSGPVDLIEELRLRRWARENYVSADSRPQDWHDVVLDEMTRKDRELMLNGEVTVGWDVHSN